MEPPTPFIDRNESQMSYSSDGRAGDMSPMPGSATLLTEFEEQQGHAYPAAELLEKGGHAPAAVVGPSNRRRKLFIVAGALLVLAAVGIGVGVGVSKTCKSCNKTAASGSGATGGSGNGNNTGGSTGKLWGVGGDTITTDDGSTFVYNNTFGGTWVSIPFNDTARAQDTSPPLDEPWKYGQDRIYGVNLGGWLVLEPFIAPYLFEPYQNSTPQAVDEWTLSQAAGENLSTAMEEHYSTFITEKDFAEIASAGLSWVRLPVGWWMIEVWPGEPFLEGVSFKYFLKAIEWARKYGIRINLDLHAVPGSQNGYNHSGKLGTINFLMGTMGIANAQRTINYIRTLAEFISQPQYANVVTMFSVINEPLMTNIGPDVLREFYYQAYQVIRGISGIGEGKGPMIVMHDGFDGPDAGQLSWGGYLEGADRIAIDTHPYLMFTTQKNDSMTYNAQKPCAWAPAFNETFTNFGFSMAGEFSVAVNDCGYWLNFIGYGSRYEGTWPNASDPSPLYPRVGSCDPWNDYTTWSANTKKGFADMAASSQDALQNSFFWTWKIGRSLNSNLLPNPMWHYQLGLQEGYIYPDARGSIGGCARAGAEQSPPTTFPTATWAGTFSAWQTGGPGAGQINSAAAANYSAWPPATILGGPNNGNLAVANLYKYTSTGSPVTLTPTQPPATAFPSGATATAAGNGWDASKDTAGWYVSASGCNYPNPWEGNGQAAPAAPCPAGAQKRHPRPTGPPVVRKS